MKTPAYTNVGLEGEKMTIWSKPSKRSLKKLIIFLVDDDLLFLKTLQQSISIHINSLNLFLFRTGEECLLEMKRKKPDIVVLDYFLNSEVANASNGALIMKEIKKISPKTNVIMLSSQDSLRTAIDCIDNGAYDYISKSQTALVRINNTIKHIIGDLEADSLVFKICEYILVILTLGMLAYGILNF